MRISKPKFPKVSSSFKVKVPKLRPITIKRPKR